MTFKPGDLVRLKSGGHVMTVQDGYDTDAGPVVGVVWAFEGCISSYNFAEEVLEPATQNDKCRDIMAEIASGLPPCEGNCTDHDGGCGKPDCVWNETSLA